MDAILNVFVLILLKIGEIVNMDYSLPVLLVVTLAVMAYVNHRNKDENVEKGLA